MTRLDDSKVSLRELVAAPEPFNRGHADEVDLYDMAAFPRGEPMRQRGDRLHHDARAVRTGDVLLSRRNDAPRRAWVVGPGRGRPQAATSDWLVLRSDRLDPAYARHVLVSTAFQMHCVGSRSARRRAAVDVPDVDLYVPSIDVQVRMGRLLDHADALRSKRRAVLGCEQALARSFFAHAFGIQPEAVFPSVSLGAVLGEPPQRGVDANLFGQGPFPLLRPADLRDGRVSFAEAKYVSHSNAMLARTALVDGDVLLACDAVRGDVRSAVARPGPSVWFTHTRVWRLRVDARRVAPEYLHVWLCSDAGRRKVLQAWTINRRIPVEQRLQEISLPLPPIEPQRTFAASINAADRLEGCLRASGDALDTLLGTLRDLAYRGDLKLA